MPATWPATVRTFSVKVDGATVLAEHINSVQEEVAAIQSNLGVNPQGSYATVKARIAGANLGTWAAVEAAHTH